MSACKTFLIEEMLHGVREVYRRIAVRNQLNCRGSRLHSRTTHHEGVVSLTPRILFSTAKSQLCNGLSISLPCRKGGSNPHLTRIYARRNCEIFEEPDMSV